MFVVCVVCSLGCIALQQTSNTNRQQGTDRRQLLQSLVVAMTTTASSGIIMLQTKDKGRHAADEDVPFTRTGAPIRRPFAPAEYLLPAVRVKRTIDDATSLARTLVASSSSSDNAVPSETEEALQELQSLLLKPQNYVQAGLKLQGVPQRPSQLYLKAYQPMKGDLPLRRRPIQGT